MARESDLYPPIKRLLESQGYEVKSEIDGCDIVACKANSAMVIVEMKLVFSLELVLQGINRLSLCDNVYLAVPAPDTPAKRRNWRSRQREVQKLCRRLGLGLILVDLDRVGDFQTSVLLDPVAYQPRKNRKRQTRLQTEFATRTGDPNTAGVTRSKIITAYRQDALRCAAALRGNQRRRIADIKETSGVSRAGSILQKNHYGWFDRTARGVYRLSGPGRDALVAYQPVVRSLLEKF